MNYAETLEYLFAQLPMYQRQGKAAYKADLASTWALMDVLNHPYKSFKTIHVAGTNGKGSTTHMLASVLQEAGYKVGMYTSPHLIDFRERVRVNGEMISESAVVDFVKKHKAEFESIQLSFFEWTVGLAFEHFKNEAVDIAVIEVGMGGRLDSTNVIRPELSVITNIGLDHTQFLGDTLELVAGEKAGIIKSNVPVIIGEDRSETRPVFEAKAKLEGTPISFVDQNQSLAIESDLKGAYQQFNIRTSLAVVSKLNELGFSISDDHVKDGLSQVAKNTGMLGRWQVLQTRPLTICDTAHNVEGLSLVMEQVKSLNKTTHIVFGMVNDKAANHILKLLPKNASYYFCAAKIPRSMPVEELSKQAIEAGLNGVIYDSVEAAYDAAKESAKESARKSASAGAGAAAGEEDLIFIGGSTFVVAEVLPLVK